MILFLELIPQVLGNTDSVRYLGLLLWSKLDAEVREQQSVDAFKKLIRKQNLAALIAYCAILRISFVIEYVYILLVFYDIYVLWIFFFYILR